MKRSLYIPAASCVMAAALLAASCSGGSNAAKDSASGESTIKEFTVNQSIKSSERNYLVTFEGDSVYVDFSTSIHWPEKIGSADLTTLRDSLMLYCYADTADRNIDRAIISFMTNTSAIDSITPDEKIVAVDSIPEGMDYMRSWFANVTASIYELNEDMVTYNVVTSSYLGGAHPFTSTRPFTYDLRTGRVLNAENMFVAGSFDELMQIITNTLANQLNVKPSQLENAGIFVNQLTYPGQPYIAGGAVVFHYNQYDIAPYSMGPIEVTVYPNEINHILTPEVKTLFDDQY
ncbi:MAG: RsiV family protein [Muribaculaceae bacterium]|nr:RsiV family protein [Muribaculaceae bacterium]